MNNGSTHDPLRKIQAPQSPESKADIGSTLKAARQKRGHSIEAVVSHTRIPKKFVDALENNRLEEFPALAYLRGFLKTYCDYLEVDFDALWKQLQPPAPAADPEAGGSQPSHAPSGKDSAHGAGEPGGAKKKDHGHHHAADGLPLGALVVAGLAVVAALVLALSLRKGAEEGRGTQASHAETPAALEPLNKQAGPALSIEFLDNAWVSVEPDGKISFEGFVPRNSRQDWKAKKTLLLRTNHPEALRLALNGAKYALPARRPDGAYVIEAP